MDMKEQQKGLNNPSLGDESVNPLGDAASSINSSHREGRRGFLKKLGIIGASIALWPRDTFAQLGGNVGPEAAPPPDVSDPANPLPDNRSPEAREVRESYMLPIEFLNSYNGKDPRVEAEASETFKKLFGIASQVSGVVPALQQLNSDMARQDDPNKNIDNGHHLVSGLGPNNKYGAVRIGVRAHNPEVDNVLNINPKKALTLVRKVETYTKTDTAEEKILLTNLLVVGRPDPQTLQPDNIGLIVESVLYPSNKMKSDKRILEQKIGEMNRSGQINIDELKNQVFDPNSEFNIQSRTEAWSDTLESFGEILKLGNWRLDPDLEKFYNGYLALKPASDDSPEIKEKKLKDLRDYISNSPFG
jgi:hypothetical protein